MRKSCEVMAAPWRRFTCALTTAALLLAQVAPPTRAQAQDPAAAPATPTASAPMSRADYEACQARDENGFRIAVSNLTRKGLEKGLANVNTKGIVADGTTWKVPERS